MYGMILVLTAAMASVGCSKKEQPSQVLHVAEEPVDLVAQWHEIPKAGHESMDVGSAIEIANAMAASGPNGLDPLLRVLEEPEESPTAKMLAVICLSPHMQESFLPRLTALTQPEHNQATRGCAAHLLGVSGAPEAEARVRELFADPDKHVRKAAVLIMTRRGDKDALAQALTLWEDPDISDADRSELVLGFPDHAAADNLHIFAAAFCMTGLDGQARSRAIQLLGLLGGADLLPAMDACLEQETDANLRDMLDAAITAVRSRTKEGVSITPVAVPQDASVEAAPTETADSPK